MRNRISIAILAAALFAFAGLAGAPTAKAQCPNITVFNFTGCDVTLCLYDNVNVNPTCANIPAVGGPFNIALVAPFTPVGVVSAGKNQYPFAGAPACTPCIRLPSFRVVTGCCAQVCYDAATCTITINPCGPPCLP